MLRAPAHAISYDNLSLSLSITLRRAVGRKIKTKNMCAVFANVHENAIPEK